MDFLGSTTGKVLTVMSASTVLATGALYCAYTVTKKKKKKKAGTPELSREKLIVLFTDISGHMQKCLMSIKQQVMAVIQSEKAANISEEEIFAFMSKSLKDQMASAEKQLYEKHGTNLKAVKAAAQKYKDDPTFKRLTDKMKTLDAECKPRKPPAGFDETKCVAMLEEMAENYRAVLASAVAEQKAAGHPVQPQIIQLKIAQSHSEIVRKLGEKHGFKPEQFDAIVSNFSDSAKVKACVQKLAKLPSEHGLPTSYVSG